MNAQTKETQSNITPQKALEMLKEGNQRFLENKNTVHYLPAQIKQTSTAQFPFAVILGCIDSRVPPEVIFDLGIGDAFCIRIAGNFVNSDIIGSMEFACKVVGAKHILVLGHTNCGAIQGAYDDVELGHLTELVNKLKPAVKAVKKSESTAIDLNKVAEKNVHLTVQQISHQSSILRDMLQKRVIAVSGAMYDVSTGEVTFLSE